MTAFRSQEYRDYCYHGCEAPVATRCRACHRSVCEEHRAKAYCTECVRWCVFCDEATVDGCPRCGQPLCPVHLPRRRRVCDDCESEYQRRLAGGDMTLPGNTLKLWLAAWLLLPLPIAILPDSLVRSTWLGGLVLLWAVGVPLGALLHLVSYRQRRRAVFLREKPGNRSESTAPQKSPVEKARSADAAVQRPPDDEMIRSAHAALQQITEIAKSCMTKAGGVVFGDSVTSAVMRLLLLLAAVAFLWWIPSFACQR